MDENSRDVFAAMQKGVPYRTYRKTILGKVYVTALDPFSESPMGILLYGEPKGQDAKIDIWTDIEDIFFKRMNKNHFERGNLIQIERTEEELVKERTIEEFSDKELKTVINQKFLALQSTLNKTNTEAVLYRLIAIAKEEEKSEKIIRAIEARLSEIQSIPSSDIE